MWWTLTWFIWIVQTNNFHNIQFILPNAVWPRWLVTDRPDTDQWHENNFRFEPNAEPAWVENIIKINFKREDNSFFWNNTWLEKGGTRMLAHHLIVKINIHSRLIAVLRECFIWKSEVIYLSYILVTMFLKERSSFWP